ncbi:MAG TPA: lysine--tRNA ligase [Solirubrobacteraceae bacterium]|nr:lysine--tRNA ligase [Solirubrobacteraceae bacterium]
MNDEPRPESELLAERRAKGARLHEDGVRVPYRFTGVVPIEQVRAQFATLGAGKETEEIRRVAGRLAARRGQGRMAFLDLVDRSGRLQLQARVDELGEERLAQLLSLDLGDVIGVDGIVFRSRRGELSLRVSDYELLAKSLRPPPDKFHGLTDTETRYRQRELDLIANEDTRRLFIDRARIIAAVRGYLDGEGFVELETPVLQPLYGGAMARPFTTHHNALDRDLYLRIATELYLKRAIVGGLERVYELGKNFRNEGLSPKHNPEFTVVEWYEAYADYQDEAARLEAIVAAAADAVGYEGELRLRAPFARMTFHEAIRKHADIELVPSVEELGRRIKARYPEMPTEGFTWFQLADDLLSKLVEPKLQQPTFIFDYPVELSPLAREHRSHAGLVERWECFVGGYEIANAFSELADPDEQRRRFEAQRRLAVAGEEEAQPYDESFVRALEQGMPPTGGVGVGIDRLVMVLTGRRSIREVLLFPAMR